MLFNYPRIYTFDYSEMAENLDYIFSKYSSICSISKDIENQSFSIQDSFDVAHPNISFRAGEMKYSKENQSFLAQNTYTANITSASFVSENSVLSDDNLLIPLDQKRSAVGYLNQIFLQKNKYRHSVNWSYDVSLSIGLFDGDEVPGVRFALSKFYKKNNATIRQVKVSSCLSPHNVVNLKYLNSLVNKIDSTLLTFSAELILYNNLAYRKGLLPNDISISSVYIKDCAILSPSSENEVIDSLTATSSFLQRDLGNTLSLNATSETSFLEKNEKAILSLPEINSYSAEFLEPKTTSFSGEFGAISSGGDEAQTWDNMYQYISLKLAYFYKQSLMSFVEVGTTDSELKSLYDYINNLIARLKKSYLSSTECSLHRAPNNKDEPCFILCEDLDFSEKNLMLSKQKMVASIKCALSCS